MDVQWISFWDIAITIRYPEWPQLSNKYPRDVQGMYHTGEILPIQHTLSENVVWMSWHLYDVPRLSWCLYDVLRWGVLCGYGRNENVLKFHMELRNMLLFHYYIMKINYF